MAGQIILSILLSTALAALAWRKKALTGAALALAWLLSTVITFCGGWPCFVALAATFIFMVLAGKAGGGRRPDQSHIHAKTGQRDGVQVFCNVGIGAILLLIYAFSQEIAFRYAFGAVMAASLADTMASELGILSRRQPRDICSGQTVRRGISGGVTALGLAAALAGATIIGALFALCLGQGWTLLLLVTAGGFTGSLIDSVLGSRLQIKYCCPRCHELTERQEHCGVPTQRSRGFALINNDTVNLLTNMAVGLLAVVLFAVIGL